MPFQYTRISTGVTEGTRPLDFRTQIHFIQHAIRSESRNIEMNYLFAFFDGQKRKYRQASLPNTQCNSSADVARERADRKGAVAYTEANGVRTASHQQKDRFTRVRAQTQKHRAIKIAHPVWGACPSCQREELDAEAIHLRASVLLDDSVFRQRA